MDIDKLTIGELKQLQALMPGGATAPSASPPRKRVKSHSMKVGMKVLIRTVTLYYTGEIREITASDILLGNAAWIPDTGRYAAALTSGELGEVEPLPDWVIVPRGGIIDIAPWDHALPRKVKP